MHPPLSSKETALYSPRPDGQGSHRSISFSSPHENRFAGFSRGPRRSCRKRMRRARWKRKAPGASTRDCAGNFQSKRWARAQICVIFQLSARDELLSCVGVQDRLCLLLFPLPPGQRVAERNARGKEDSPFRWPPTALHPRLQIAAVNSFNCRCTAHSAGDYQIP